MIMSPVRAALREGLRRQALNTAMGCGVAVLILGTASFFAAFARAETKQEATFCFNDWPPMTFVRSGRAEGISVEIVREAMRRIGIEAAFRELPWKRCLLLVEGGEIDAVIDAAVRPNFVQGPTSFSSYSDTVWVHQDSGKTSLRDLRGASFGLVEGFSYDTKTMSALSALAVELSWAVDDPTNIRKLAFARVDAIIADLTSTLHFSRANKVDIRPILPPIYIEPLFVSFNNGRTDLQRRFDESVKKLIDEGFVDAVYKRHIGKTYGEMHSND